jgi:hypothetical protein
MSERKNLLIHILGGIAVVGISWAIRGPEPLSVREEFSRLVLIGGFTLLGASFSRGQQ